MKYFTNALLSRNTNFRYLFMGQAISNLGTMITMVALPYQIYHLTHSNLMVGLISVAQLLPLLITALVGGAIADRHHRKHLLLFSECALALGCLLLTRNATSHTPSIIVIFVIAALMSAVNGLHRPALESLTQQIVDKKDFPIAGALRIFVFNFCMITGPALGGILIAVFGLPITYLLDFMSFGVALLGVSFVRNVSKPLLTTDESTLKSLLSGIRYTTSRQDLLGTYFVDFFAMIFGMPQALFPAIASLHGGAKTLGFLYAAPAIGGIIVSFFTHFAARIKRHGIAIAVAATLWGGAIIGFGLSKNLWLALFFLALAGGFDAISGAYRSLMWNSTIPNHFRGRLAGIEMISYLSGPKLGDAEAGLVAAAFGITFSVVSGGILCILTVGACCYFLPKFWHYRSEEPQEPRVL